MTRAQKCLLSHYIVRHLAFINLAPLLSWHQANRGFRSGSSLEEKVIGKTQNDGWCICYYTAWFCVNVINVPPNAQNRYLVVTHKGVFFVNSLRSSDAIWWQRSGSTLAQVMACCLMVPSHYLNQCWPIISELQRQSPEGNFTRDTSAINYWNYLEHHISKISFRSPRGQWVKFRV